MAAQPRIAPSDDGDDLSVSGAERVESIETRLASVERRTGRLELGWAGLLAGGVVMAAVVGYGAMILNMVIDKLWK